MLGIGAPLGKWMDEKRAKVETFLAYSAEIGTLSALSDTPGDGGAWQPIETAPEGQHLIVWLPNYGHVTACRTGREWFAQQPGENVYPSHWRPMLERPLPDAPER